MADNWKTIPISEKLFSNVKEACLGKSNAALENVFVNDANGISRFPGLSVFSELPGNGRVYLGSYGSDLIAATSDSLVYRVDDEGNASDVTEVPISGGRRVVFAESDRELLMAAGGQIIRFQGEKTTLLSDDAPIHTTHVAQIDGYILAIEDGSFRHNAAGESTTWEALDTFAASSQADNINALLVTPFRELMVAGLLSIEQFERLSSGDIPFFRRWAVGEGVLAPYTFIAADNATWFINKRHEFVRASAQISQSRGDDLGRTFEGITDAQWADAWAALINIVGHKFILLQIPTATNIYGTMGITVVFDFSKNRWLSLYGWDTRRSVQNRWPGWSYYNIWGRHFVGGEGKIYELKDDVYTNDGVLQKVLGRTAHVREWGESAVNNVRAHIKRGAVGANDDVPEIWLRAHRNNSTWTRWKKKTLGRGGETEVVVDFGAFGDARSWQFEYMTTGNSEFELISLQAEVQKTGR